MSVDKIARDAVAALKAAARVKLADDLYIVGRPDLVPASVEVFRDNRVAALTTTDGRQWMVVGDKLMIPRTNIDANDQVIFLPGFTGTPLSVILFGDGRVSSLIEVSGRRWFYSAGWTVGETVDQTRKIVTDVFVPGFVGTIEAVSLFTDDRASAVIDNTGKRWFYSGGWTYAAATASGDLSVDVLIYGSSVGGQTAAARAKMRGKTVAVIEPYPSYGGAHAHGLCWVDKPELGQVDGDWNKTIGGLTRSVYFDKVAELEGQGFNGRWKAKSSTYERAAQAIIAKYADMAFLDVQIDGPRNLYVETDGVSGLRDIKGVMTPRGLIRCGVAIDASYEMDLSAAATGPQGVLYGRESASAYNEPLAGVTNRTIWQNSAQSYPWRDYNGSSPASLSDLPTDLPLILPDPQAAIGSGDRSVQAYNFRLNHTRNPANYLPFDKPSGYDHRYALLLAESNIVRRNLTTICRQSGSLGWMGLVGSGDRYQWNQFDLANLQEDYTLASWSKRREIMANHVFLTKCLFWFIANDPKAREYGMAALQDDLNDVTRPAGFAASGPVGLCADEFQGSPVGNGWPYWMYVRETRRLKARRIMTQLDQMSVANGGTPTKADTVGKWAYVWDKHVSTLQKVNDGAGVPYTNRFAQEGGTAGLTAWYQMSADMMWPDASLNMRNLIVPVCSGNTSVAWGPQRLEAAYGILGEAAGENAAWLADNPTMRAEQQPYSDLRARLIERGSILD